MGSTTSGSPPSTSCRPSSSSSEDTAVAAQCPGTAAAAVEAACPTSAVEADAEALTVAMIWRRELQAGGRNVRASTKEGDPY